jgi:hypothetical protein
VAQPLGCLETSIGSVADDNQNIFTHGILLLSGTKTDQDVGLL